MPHSRPAAYRILYRVHNAAGQSTQVLWQQLTVKRPFLASDATFPVRPGPGDPPVGGTVTSVDGLFSLSPSGTRKIAGRQPGVGTGDQALGPVLREAARRQLAKAGGRRTVAGRACHDIRVLEPPAGAIKALGNQKAGFDDLCLDDDGLVLREEWHLQGRVVLRREAVEVDTEPSGLDTAFDVSAATGGDPTLAAPAADPLTQVDSGVTAPVPPAGYRQEAAVDFRFPDPQRQGGLAYVSQVWAFARGADVITVEIGTSEIGIHPWGESDVTRPVTLKAGQKAESVVRSDGGEIRYAGAKRWIRVRGTVDLKALAAYARHLTF